MDTTTIGCSIDGGSTEGEDRVSKVDYYRVEGGELPAAEQEDSTLPAAA
jgi:hypothetical protein